MERVSKSFAVGVLVLLAGCATEQAAQDIKPESTLTKTDRPLDLAIDGPGFFIYSTGTETFVFSRNGHLFVDPQGWLVNEDGYRLVPTEAVPPGATEVHIERDGRVLARSDASAELQLVGDVRLASFADPAKLKRDGVYLTPTSASGDPKTGVPGTAGFGSVVAGALKQ